LKNHITTAFLVVFVLSLTGCPAAPTDSVSGAKQSDIEAYQAAERAEQAALSGEMKSNLEPKKAPKKPVAK
jgi:starvation-inducible outer membrane lipoprotein